MTRTVRLSIGQERALLLTGEHVRRSGPAADFTADKPMIVVRRPEAGELLEFGVDWLMPFPNLRDAVASALVRYLELPSVRSAASHHGAIRLLKSGLLSFLTSTQRQGVHPWQMDRSLFSSFIRWLDEPTANGNMLNAKSKISLYQSGLRLASLMPEGSRPTDEAESLPPAPWKVRESGARPEADVMPVDDVRTIVRKCADMIRETSSVLKESFAAIKAGDHHADAMSDRVALLRALAAMPPEARTSRSLATTDRRLLRKLRAAGLPDIYRVVLPSLKDVLPFIIMLVVALRLNDSVVRSAALADFRSVNSFGGRRLIASPIKPRKGGRILASVPATSDPTNPFEMIALLDRWLSPFRAAANTDLLLVFWKNHPTPGPMTLDRINSDETLTHAVRRFAADNDLPHFTLTRLRKTMLDVAHERSGGDLIAVKAAASHASVATTDAHYVSRAGRRREDQRLATAMRRRQLGFLAGGGESSPEGGDDATSCTPGWRCDKPGATPFHAPRVDGLCIAYGRCPVCVHGSTDLSSVQCARLAEALVEAIDRSLETVDPASWLGRLAPIRRRLVDKVIRRFPTSVLAAAAAMPPLSLPTLD